MRKELQEKDKLLRVSKSKIRFDFGAKFNFISSLRGCVQRDGGAGHGAAAGEDGARVAAQQPQADTPGFAGEDKCCILHFSSLKFVFYKVTHLVRY